MYFEIKNKILECSKVAILSHVTPDGDNIGSSLALCNALRSIGKQAEYILDDDIPRVYSFLKGAEDIKKPNVKDDFDLVIVLDCGDIERLGKAQAYLKNHVIINIDHHISNTRFGEINHIASDACATGELIYYLLKEMDIEINKSIAECLYTAIVTDTGMFQYSNTTAATLEIAADLLRKGVVASDIFKRIYQSQPKEKVMLIKKALGTLEFYHNDMLSCITLSVKQLKEAGALDSDTENIINFARDIDGVEVAVFLKEIDERKVKASFRSKSKVDVSKIAVSFGGGGHIRASGCTINNSLEAAKEKVIKAVLAELNGGDA